MQRNDLRRYILLRPVAGEAAGTARMENVRGRMGVHIHARYLPEGPVRALLICGRGQYAAVTDLGLMRWSADGQSTLSRDNLAVEGKPTALALVSDWPQAQLLMYGWVQNQPGFALWQLQEAVAQYLSVPAPDSAPSPAESPENSPKPSVLRLRGRVSP